VARKRDWWPLPAEAAADILMSQGVGGGGEFSLPNKEEGAPRREAVVEEKA
jgi:hypothetical protein